MFNDYKPKYTLRFNKRSVDEKTKSDLEKSLFYNPMSYEGIIIDECYEQESGESAGEIVGKGGTYIPFYGSMKFELTEISCVSQIRIVNEDVRDEFEELSLKENIDLDFKVEDEKQITGKLKKMHEDTSPYLSLFGTDERIEDLSFIIGTGSNIKKESALLEGGTLDVGYLRILIAINQERFDEISKLINLKKLDSFSINIYGTEGFYYELNDDSQFNQFNPKKVKVLTSEMDNHKIPKKYKKEIIPVLGKTQSVFISTVTSQSFVNKKKIIDE